MKRRSIENKIGQKTKEWLLAALIAVLATMLIKGFVVETYMVATKRMENSLNAGDFVLVNKLAYGGRLPITPLSLPFGSMVYSEKVQWPYKRLKGYSTIQRNDVLVINKPTQRFIPVDKRDKLIKRCVALPGDTLEIKNKNLKVNNTYLPMPPGLKFRYRVVTNGNLIEKQVFDTLQISDVQLVSQMGIYDITLDENQRYGLSKVPDIRYMHQVKKSRYTATENTYPDGLLHWNADYFGPLVVPEKGVGVYLDRENYFLYHKTIKQFEGKTIEWINNAAWLDGKKIYTYTFTQNYYFVLDDNRDYADDSRTWGFLPESHVIGKVGKVLFSKN